MSETFVWLDIEATWLFTSTARQSYEVILWGWMNKPAIRHTPGVATQSTHSSRAHIPFQGHVHQAVCASPAWPPGSTEVRREERGDVLSTWRQLCFHFQGFVIFSGYWEQWQLCIRLRDPNTKLCVCNSGIRILVSAFHIKEMIRLNKPEGKACWRRTSNLHNDTPSKRLFKHLGHEGALVWNSYVPTAILTVRSRGHMTNTGCGKGQLRRISDGGEKHGTVKRLQHFVHSHKLHDLYLKMCCLLL